MDLFVPDPLTVTVELYHRVVEHERLHEQRPIAAIVERGRPQGHRRRGMFVDDAPAQLIRLWNDKPSMGAPFFPLGSWLFYPYSVEELERW